MPTYEYRCAECGETFDIFQKFSARSLRKHEGCGGELSKVIHPAGIVFKGSGFYTTDSRKAESPTAVSGKKDSDSGAKDSGPKDSGTKDSGTKETKDKKAKTPEPSTKSDD